MYLLEIPRNENGQNHPVENITMLKILSNMFYLVEIFL
jgi:hypothetical protein